MNRKQQIRNRLKAILTACNINFIEGQAEASPISDEFYANTTSKTGGENYAMLLNSAGMRRFLGERVARKLNTMEFTVPNAEWEDSIEIAQKDVDDDSTGKYLTYARTVGAASRLLGDDVLVDDLLPNGETALAIDGQNYFDDSHPITGRNGEEITQSNLLTGNALTAANFEKALAQLKSLKDFSGRSVNRGASAKIKLVVPAELEVTANEIVNEQYTSVGVPNPNYQKAEIVVLDLADATSWYVMNTGGTGINKPFIKQTRQEEGLTSTQGGDLYFHNRIFYLGTFWRGAFAYGLYQYAVKSKA